VPAAIPVDAMDIFEPRPDLVNESDSSIDASIAAFLRYTPRDLETSKREAFALKRGDIGRLMRKQFEMDDANHDNVPELFDIENEYIPELGLMHLGRSIHSGSQSTVFDLEPIPEFSNEQANLGKGYIIKYELNCHDVGAGVHPLVSDYHFGVEAFRLGLGPRPVYISPPAIFNGERTRKTDFDMDHEELKECLDGSANLRYLVVEKINGKTFHRVHIQSPEGQMDMKQALGMGAFLISALERLHASNIIHGDIHAGNVMVESNDAGGGVLMSQDDEGKIHGLKLIDFGRARLSRGRRLTDQTTPVNGIDEYFHHMYSHWIMDGYEWEKRDDVFRAIQVIATMMNFHESYYGFERGLMTHSRVRLMDWKRKGFIFEIPNGPPSRNPFARLTGTEKTKSLIRKDLRTVLSLVRKLDISSPIPYDRIVGHLQKCRELLP